MDTTDDPVTLLLIGGAAAGGAALGGAFGGGGDIPSVEARTEKRTAAPVEQVSDEARRNRRRQASILTKDFGEPKLGLSGLFEAT